MNASATSDNASLLYYCYNCMKAEIITTIVFQLVTDTECKPSLLAWHHSKKKLPYRCHLFIQGWRSVAMLIRLYSVGDAI